MQTGRVRIKKAAAAVLLACIFLAVLLLAELRREAPENPEITSPFGMVLINIADQKVAASYHVDELGVYVLAVDENSQAYRAGVRSGDRIVSVNGAAIHSTGDLEAAQRLFPPASMVRMDYRPQAQDQLFTASLLWSGDAGR